jgi:hypothetical protein
MREGKTIAPQELFFFRSQDIKQSQVMYDLSRGLTPILSVSDFAWDPTRTEGARSLDRAIL